MEAIKAQTIKVEINNQQAKNAQEVQQTRQKTVEWNQKNTLQLIRLWEQNTCLYDPGTKMFNNKFARCEALSRMVNLLKEDIPNLTIEDVQVKINSLRSQYLHELARIQKHGKIEAASDKNNVSSAYWFPSLQFLKPFVKPNKRCFEMDSHNNCIDDPEISQDNSNFEDEFPFVPPNDEKYRRNSPDTQNLTDATHAIRSLTTSMEDQNSKKFKYSNDIEAFGEHVKAEMNKIFNDELRDEAFHKFSDLVYSIKQKQRNFLNIDPST